MATRDELERRLARAERNLEEIAAIEEPPETDELRAARRRYAEAWLEERAAAAQALDALPAEAP